MPGALLQWCFRSLPLKTSFSASQSHPLRSHPFPIPKRHLFPVVPTLLCLYPTARKSTDPLYPNRPLWQRQATRQQNQKAVRGWTRLPLRRYQSAHRLGLIRSLSSPPPCWTAALSSPVPSPLLNQSSASPQKYWNFPKSFQKCLSQPESL
ncbi:hypothetical protein Chor_013354 [Crotalus horridus]